MICKTKYIGPKTTDERLQDLLTFKILEMYNEGYKYKEIAKKVGIDIGMVGSRLKALPKHLRKVRWHKPEDQLETYLITRIELDSATGCWIWKGTKPTDRGYARIRTNGKDYLVHRVSYWLFKNDRKPLPKNLHVLHSCDRPLCINPKHLRLGTDKENALDKVGRMTSFWIYNKVLEQLTKEEKEVFDSILKKSREYREG